MSAYKTPDKDLAPAEALFLLHWNKWSMIVLVQTMAIETDGILVLHINNTLELCFVQATSEKFKKKKFWKKNVCCFLGNTFTVCEISHLCDILYCTLQPFHHHNKQLDIEWKIIFFSSVHMSIASYLLMPGLQGNILAGSLQLLRLQ